MTLTQKLLSVASLGLAFASVSIAQQATTTTTTTAASLLGVQYVEAGFGYLDINHFDRGIYSLGANVNVPMSSNLDVGAGYSHQWLENNDSFYLNALELSATAYLTEGSFRPFATAGIGYVWEGSGDDNYGIWNAGGGVEYSFNATTAVRVGGGYSDNFESGDNGSFAGNVSLSHWFTGKIAGTVGVSWFEGGDVGYGVSGIFKF